MRIIPHDHRGRTITGKFAYRASIEMEPDDFPADSVYWERQAQGMVAELQKTFPDEQIDVWFEETFPEGSTCTWKDIALKARKLLHTLIIAKEPENS